MAEYKKNSLSLTNTVALGTGVMIGAGIFALLGQVAELSGQWFPFAFLIGAVISGFSSYTYVKMSNTYPSAGGIGRYLKKVYGKTAWTATGALLMALSMVINESLVARTFGTYVLELFDVESKAFWPPILGVLLLITAFIVNVMGNKAIGRSSLVMAILKIGGIAVFAIGGLWAAGFTFDQVVPSQSLTEHSLVDYLGALALSILAYKGFTTITNSGDEIVDPKRNVGRAIVISLVICTLVYLMVAFAVSSNLSIQEIIAAKDYSLAEASRPAFGKYGVWFTVGLAIISTVSGVVASIFAVSRMTTMLTEKELIPHRHFGIPGDIQKHMLVYTVVIAIGLTMLFDLSRIAALGAIFYLIMDIGIHWGVLNNLRKEIGANPIILITALVLDVLVLGAFIWSKAGSDLLVVIVALVLMVLIFFGERLFLGKKRTVEEE